MSKFDPLWVNNRDDWATPPELYNKLNKLFGFTVDVCANPINHKADRWFGQQEDNVFVDGLTQDWRGEVCFMNPPYSAVDEWLAKAVKECSDATIVSLVYARTDTKWFHSSGRKAQEIVCLKGRVKFVGADSGAPAPSILLIHRPYRGVRTNLSYWDWKNEDYPGV